MQRWKWRAGDFFRSLSSGKRMMYKAVRFAADDIDEIYRNAREARTDILKGAGGRKPSAARDDVWLWIVRKVAQEGRDAVAHKAQVVQSIFRDQGWEKQGPLKTKSVENIVAKARKALGVAKAARATEIISPQSNASDREA